MRLFGGTPDAFSWQADFIADFADEAGKHQLDFMDRGFERIMLPGRQELKIPREQKEIVQFAGRAEGDREVLFQLYPSGHAAAFSDVGGNGECGALHLARQTITFRLRKRAGDPVNAQGHCVAFLPNQEFRKILHVSIPLFLFLPFWPFTHNLLLTIYNLSAGAVQC